MRKKKIKKSKSSNYPCLHYWKCDPLNPELQVEFFYDGIPTGRTFLSKIKYSKL